MKDRVSTYPGRVKLTPVTGQTDTYDMERADVPIEAGTALNKANLFSDTTAGLYEIWGTAGAHTPVETVNEALASVPLYDKIYTADSYSATQIRVYCPRFAYVDGAAVTFKSDVSNNGASTRLSVRGIGWKYLYKEGTVSTPPNIVAGRIYTAWYDATGDCFFVRAGGGVTLSSGTDMTLYMNLSVDKAVPASKTALFRLNPATGVDGKISVELRITQTGSARVDWEVGDKTGYGSSGDMSPVLSNVDFSKPVNISVWSPTGTSVQLRYVIAQCARESLCTGTAL